MITFSIPQSPISRGTKTLTRRGEVLRSHGVFYLVAAVCVRAYPRFGGAVYPRIEISRLLFQEEEHGVLLCLPCRLRIRVVTHCYRSRRTTGRCRSRAATRVGWRLT